VAQGDMDDRLRSAYRRSSPRTRESSGSRGDVIQNTAHPVHRTGVVEGTWNGPAAVAGAPNRADVLWHMHAIRDSGGDPDSKGSYHLPHHAPRMGSPANLAGVRNALARLSQLKGVSASDKAGAERHLRAHLAEAERRSDD
jgi:hypothetical protein